MSKDINEMQQGLFQILQETVTDLRTEWNSKLGTFQTLEGTLATGTTGENPEVVAQQFVTRYSDLLGPRVTVKQRWIPLGLSARRSINRFNLRIAIQQIAAFLLRVFGIRRTTVQYKVFRNVPAREGGRRISIQLIINGLVALEGRIVAYVDEELVLRKIKSSLPRSISVTAESRISKGELVKILLEIFNTHPDAEEYLQRERERTRNSFPLTSTPTMVLFRTEDGFHPAWMGFAILPVDVELPTLETEWILTQAEYYLDASNGELLKAEATIEYAEVSIPVVGHAVIRPDNTLVVVNAQGVQKDGAEYYLKNIDNDIDIITYDANGDGTSLDTKLNNNTLDISEDADGNWEEWTDSCDDATRKDSQQPEIDAHRFATQIYEFYEGLGWKGLDDEGWGAGCPIRMVTHIGTSTGTGASCEKYDDAVSGNKHIYLQFYDGGCEAGSIKYDFYAGELGTIAHEYQHAVTYFGVPKSTGDPGGLYSDIIRGAFREGYSDSFAGFISGIWLLRAPWPTGIGVNGAPLRRIEYPRSTDNSSNTAYCDHYDDIGNDTSKYYKSMVFSHAAYLVGQGGIHDRPARDPQYIPIPPIEKEIAAQICHYALTEKFDLLPAGSSDQQMINAGKYLLEAAEDLFGHLSKEYVLVRRALYAVGLYPYDTTVDPYTKQVYGGEACMIPWGWSWRQSQQYLGLPMFYYWKSMDLFIDNGDGPEYDATIDEENKVYARVRNVGDQELNNISVEFWYRKCGSALPPAETGWNRCQDANGVDCTLNILNLPAGENNFDDVYTAADAVNWYLDPSEIIDEIDHFCLRAKIICDAPNHNNDYENFVQSNVHHVLADPDSDADATIAFQVGNPDKEKKLPLDLRIEHTLPEGVLLKPQFDPEELVLEPGEERTVVYRMHVPRQAHFPLKPPFDGELTGSIYGELCGPFKGNLSNVINIRQDRINAMISGQIEAIGYITGRFIGYIDYENGTIAGRALVAFSAIDAVPKQRNLVVGIKAKLSPIRVVNFIQMIGDEAVGGITASLILKKNSDLPRN